MEKYEMQPSGFDRTRFLTRVLKVEMSGIGSFKVRLALLDPCLGVKTGIYCGTLFVNLKSLGGHAGGHAV
jgi:hypothetical protein